MDIRQIERNVRKGAVYLSQSLWEYWPPVGDNEIAEMNMSLHLARSFGEAGFAVFGEVHTKGTADMRLDLLCLHPTERVQVVGEFKRLYSSENVPRIIEDIDRILAFKLVHNFDVSSRFGLISATTWKEDIVTWWSTMDGKLPDNYATEEWDRLEEKASELKKPVWGSTVLQGYDEKSGKETDWHYWLYLLFEF